MLSVLLETENVNVNHYLTNPILPTYPVILKTSGNVGETRECFGGGRCHVVIGVQTIPVLGYWVLANTCQYWVVLAQPPNIFLSNCAQYWADNSLQRHLATHDDLISRSSMCVLAQDYKATPVMQTASLQIVGYTGEALHKHQGWRCG